MHANTAFRPLGNQMKGLFKLVRVKQWIKNGFVLAPLLFTGEFIDPVAVQSALIATLLFCLASSATYIINDIQDIDRDRQHPKKSISRPLAAGIITKNQEVHNLTPCLMQVKRAQ